MAGRLQPGSAHDHVGSHERLQRGEALQATYPARSDGGFLTRWFMPGYDHAFARLYVKFEPGWQCGINCTKIFAFYGNRTNNQWSGFGKAGTRPSGTDWFYTALVTLNWYRQPDPGELIFYTYFPEMTQAPDGMYWGNFFFQNDPREAIQPGRWYCLELELQANNPGARDGFQSTPHPGHLTGRVFHPTVRASLVTVIRANSVSQETR